MILTQSTFRKSGAKLLIRNNFAFYFAYFFPKVDFPKSRLKQFCSTFSKS